MIYETSLVTRFGETDYMGHINNVYYFTYLEVARVNFIVGLGIGQVDDSWGYVIASVKCDFLKQLYPQQEIRILTQVRRIGNKSFSLQHHLTSMQGEVLAIGEEVIVRFDRSAQASLPLEEHVIAKLRPYEITPVPSS